MTNNLFIICYENEKGKKSNIRSILVDGLNYWSLEDVILALSIENKEITGKNNLSMKTIVSALLSTLDSDEFVNRVLDKGRSEIFVSRSGMYRVLSQDVTPAGKRFQRWLFHEVIPALNDFGVYPPPPTNSGSHLKSMALALQNQMNLLVDAIDKIDALEEKQNHHEARISKIENGFNDIPSGMTTPKDRVEFLGVININIDNVCSVCEAEFFASRCERLKPEGASRYGVYYSIETVDYAISEAKRFNQYL